MTDSGSPSQSSETGGNKISLTDSDSSGTLDENHKKAIRCPKTNEVIWTPRLLNGDLSRLLSDFEELEFLGSGGYGCVVRARNRIDGKEYAIKKIQLRKSDGFEYAIREVTAMTRLCHPYVVRYYTAWLEKGPVGLMKEEGASSETEIEEEDKDGTDGPILCLQLELCYGSLKQLMGQSLTNAKIWVLFQQLLEGVSYLHAKNIRHGDLSPLNVLLDVTGSNLQIADFGLVSLAAEGVLENDEEPPDTLYCPPELKERRFYLSSDIYSLGLILFEMFAKFETNMGRQKAMTKVKENPGELQEFLPNVEDATLNLIFSMIDSDPLARPTAEEIRTLQPWRN